MSISDILRKDLVRAVHTADLDEAHVGDIVGAFGTLRQDSGWLRRLIVLLAVLGPGLIVMVGDNDAGGVSTYAQGGQNYSPWIVVPPVSAGLVGMTVTGSFRRWERCM